MRIIILSLALLTAVIYHDPVFAYIGPGIGAGAISVVLGVLASVFLALVAILWYPIKRIIRRKKKSDKETPVAQQ